MPYCKDAATTYLNHLGFNVVRFPSQRILPLDLLINTAGQNERIGPLADLHTSDSELPETTSATAPDLSSLYTNKLRLSFGVKILYGILHGLDCDGLNIKSVIANAASMSFKFVDVVRVSVDPTKASMYLADGDFRETPVLEGFFEGKAEMYLITEVLQSKAIKVEFYQKNGAAIDLEAASLTNLAGGDIGVKRDSERKSELVFESPCKATFGFKAFRLTIADGQWSLGVVNPSKAGLVLGKPSEQVVLTPALLSETGFPISVQVS